MICQLLLFLLLFMCVTSCTVGPDYKKPELTLPKKWNTQAPIMPTNILQQDVVWWERFNDPILNNLIKEACAANMDVSMALAQIREARANLGVTEANVFPSLTAVSNFTKSHYGNDVTGTSKLPHGNFTYASAALDASWEIGIFGGLARASESAKATMQSAVENGRAVILSLLGTIATNYIQLRNYQQQLQIQHEIVQAWQIYTDLRSKLENTELINHIDTIGAIASYNQALVQIPQLEASIQTTLNQLCVLLAKAPGSLNDKLLTPRDIPQMDEVILANLPAAAIANRPDVLQAEANLRSATANIGVAEASLYPQFSLTGTFGWNSNIFPGLLSGAHSIISMGSGVSLPIFDFGKIRAQIDVQYAKRDEAFLTFKKSILLALQDVENSLVNLASESGRLVTFKKIFDDNKLAFNLNQDREQSGLNNTFDVLQSKFTYLISKQNYFNSLAQNAMNIVSVYKALGGGWNTVYVGHVDQKVDVERVTLSSS